MSLEKRKSQTKTKAAASHRNVHQEFCDILSQYDSLGWINQFFNLARRLLNEFEIEEHDPRLAFTFNYQHKDINLNFGNRYILQPGYNEWISCIVPSDFEEASVIGEYIYTFSPNSTRDAKWIRVRFPLGVSFPEHLYNAIASASADRLKRYKSSPYRKDHSSLLYHFAMDTAVRNEIMSELPPWVLPGEVKTIVRAS